MITSDSSDPNGPNYSKLRDSLKNTILKSENNYEEIRNLYLNEGLSSPQIAKKLGISKTTVLKRLKILGIAQQAPKGNPAFGFSYKGGKVVINNDEAKTCKLISRYRDQGKSYREIAALFQIKQIKRRSGSTNWDHDSIRKIYNNWTLFHQEN